VEFPENRCKVEGREDGRQSRALAHPDHCQKWF